MFAWDYMFMTIGILSCVAMAVSAVVDIVLKLKNNKEEKNK